MMSGTIISLSAVCFLLTANTRQPSDFFSTPRGVAGLSSPRQLSDFFSTSHGVAGLSTSGVTSQITNITRTSDIWVTILEPDDTEDVRWEDDCSTAVFQSSDSPLTNDTIEGMSQITEEFVHERRFGGTRPVTWHTCGYFRMNDDGSDDFPGVDPILDEDALIIYISISFQFLVFVIGTIPSWSRLISKPEPEPRTTTETGEQEIVPDKKKKNVWYYTVRTNEGVVQYKRRVIKKKAKKKKNGLVCLFLTYLEKQDV